MLVSLLGKTKTPLPSFGSGVQENFAKRLEPDRRAAQQQRAWQQSQAQVVIHSEYL
jgi:hypothetical protein